MLIIDTYNFEKLKKMAEEKQPAEVIEQVKGKVVFGPGQFGAPTPKWATMAFRYFFYITMIAGAAMDTFSFIPQEVKLEVSQVIIQANVFVHFISKCFGIKLPDVNNSGQ